MKPSEAADRLTGILAALGGALSLALAPIMVTIKYMTGWTIIPEPGWVVSARRSLERLLSKKSIWIGKRTPRHVSCFQPERSVFSHSSLILP